MNATLVPLPSRPLVFVLIAAWAILTLRRRAAHQLIAAGPLKGRRTIKRNWTCGGLWPHAAPLKKEKRKINIRVQRVSETTSARTPVMRGWTDVNDQSVRHKYKPTLWFLRNFERSDNCRSYRRMELLPLWELWPHLYRCGGRKKKAPCTGLNSSEIFLFISISQSSYFVVRIRAANHLPTGLFATLLSARR